MPNMAKASNIILGYPPPAVQHGKFTSSWIHIAAEVDMRIRGRPSFLLYVKGYMNPSHNLECLVPMGS